ncbi:MAG TPA: hypothetical protein VK789_11035 [Bryobacteraceae bacterium]|jgi:hypothetical protein|nr:hypothetical protein [Bryobacteraceae bacterium]
MTRTKRATAEKPKKRDRSTVLTSPEIVILQRAAVRAADKLAEDCKAARTTAREVEFRLKAATQCFGMLAEMRLRHLEVLPSVRGRRAKQVPLI